MKLFKIFFFCLFIQYVNAQSSYFNVKESQTYRDPYKSTKVLSVNTMPNNDIVIARMNKNILMFETFDKDAHGKKVLTIELEKNESFVGELFYGNKVKIFTVNSVSKVERILNCLVYDIENHSHKKIQLFKTTVEKKRALFSGQNKRQTNLAISPNEEFIAIATDNIKKTSNSYLVHVFNAQSLEAVYSKNYYSNPEKHYISSDMIVDDTGTVYSIGKEYFSGKRDKKNNKANYSFVLSKISKDNVATQRIELDESEYIKSIAMQLKGSALNLIGYYSEKSSYGIKGVSQFNVNTNDLIVLNKKKTELPIEVYEDIYGENSAEYKKDRELTSFDLDHVLEDKKGNTYLVAEEFYITQNYVSTGMNGGYFTTTYHYDDILITKFNPEGNLVWGRSIFKRANTPSYNVFIKDDKLHVLLNSGKNLNKKEDGRLKVSKGWFEATALYDFIFDKNGTLVHEKIQDNNKRNTKYIPYLGNYLNGVFVMYNHSENAKRLMVLESK